LSIVTKKRNQNEPFKVDTMTKQQHDLLMCSGFPEKMT